MKLKVKSIARKEFKKYAKNSRFDSWEGLPFIENLMNECSVVHEKVIVKDRKSGRIFSKIQSIQAEYAKTIIDNEEETTKQKDKIRQQCEKIKATEEAMSVEESKIKSFNENLAVSEPIFEIRTRLESLKSHKKALEDEKDKLEKELDLINARNKNRLNVLFKELTNEYINFSNQQNKIIKKIDKKIISKRNIANLYMDTFWNLCTRKKKGGETQRKPSFDIGKFRGVTKIFLDEKAKICDFNKKHGLEFTF